MIIVYHESAVNFFGLEYFEIVEQNTIKFYLSANTRVNFHFNSIKDAARAFVAILDDYREGRSICDLSGFSGAKKDKPTAIQDNLDNSAGSTATTRK